MSWVSSCRPIRAAASSACGRRRGPVLVGRVGASELTEDLLAALAARLDQKPCPPSRSSVNTRS